MRISVSHELGEQEAKRRIDAAAEDLLRTSLGGVTLTNITKKWNGNELQIGLTAKIGIISKALGGTMTVTETEVICDFALPSLLNGILGTQKIEQTVQSKVGGLLSQARS